ncbi:MAG TPA: aminoacyl-tRNA hydrolase [Desulfobulbaceae bacterium]|nr:aminoacyl-tRNA hydrolase [Desulfobulbaceae bacterium]
MIVGLGNPGSQYETTRHNAGFLALDYFAGQEGLAISSSRFHGLYGTARLAGRSVLLLKPQNFMNRSGECVAGFVQYFNVAPADILVVHDDLDLAPGRLKIADGGGAGGHNGIRSLLVSLGTDEFARLKIGIGHPRDLEETRHMPVERYVLASMPAADRDLFQDNLPRIAEGLRCFLEKGVAAAMNMVNRKSS